MRLDIIGNKLRPGELSTFRLIMPESMINE